MEAAPAPEDMDAGSADSMDTSGETGQRSARSPSPAAVGLPSKSPQLSSSPTPDLRDLVNPRIRAELKAKLEKQYRESLPDMEVLYSPDYDEEEHSVVLGKSGRVYRGTSLWGLTTRDEPRRLFISVVEARFFEPLILLTILCNCITMAWESPLDPPGTPKALLISTCEDIFLGIFTIELICKVTAYGLLSNRSAYLLDPWCQLDAAVVSLAWLPIIFPALGNYSGLRAFRALRPLRALRRLPGMPVLVQWILDVIPSMGSVSMLFSFLILVLGIVGNTSLADREGGREREGEGEGGRRRTTEDDGG